MSEIGAISSIQREYFQLLDDVLAARLARSDPTKLTSRYYSSLERKFFQANTIWCVRQKAVIA
jgi:hypothetical protein